MSNNRSSNRRRGRGGNRSQGGGNLNRIDSRARGNAPQLLEKYKKLAHDASMNGDRVQAEYYLQFADHYFRVMADSRVQRDEQRPRREFDRESSDDDDFDGEEERSERSERAPQQTRDRDNRSERDEGERGQEGSEASEQEENPFVRREPRREAKGERQPRRNGRANGGSQNGASQEAESHGLDPAALPPAIGVAQEDSTVEDKPRRARRPRARPAKAGEGGDETLEAVG